MFATNAYAMAGGAEQQAGGGMEGIVMLVIMFAIFYLLLIRPQQKRANQHKQLVENLKSGDQLPTEAQMCLAFGISRPPLREALKALTLIGILESRQGGRYMVTDLSPSRLVTPFNVLLSVADHDLMVQFEARAVVELELVRFCTERASEEQRARILSLAKDGRAFYNDPVGFRLLDAEYHQAINEGAENSILSMMSEGLYSVAIDARRLASATPGVIEISVDQHCRVAEAIAAHDAATAIEAYREHLDHVRDTTLSAMHQLSE